MTQTSKISSFKSLLAGVPRTGPTVEPMHSWDKLAKAVRDTQNYLVMAQAEEARCEETLAESRREREKAEALMAEAKAMWAQRSLDLLGIKVDVP